MCPLWAREEAYRGRDVSEEEDGEEEEDSAAEDTVVKQLSGATRGKWANDANAVEMRRPETRIDLLKPNAPAYDTVVGNGRQPRRSPSVNIHPGSSALRATGRCVQALLRQCWTPYSGSLQTLYADGRTGYHYWLRFESKSQPGPARRRVACSRSNMAQQQTSGSVFGA